MSNRDRTRRNERLLAVSAFVTIVIAWIVGASLAKSDQMPAIEAALPEADRFEQVSGDIYAGYAADEAEPIGYVAVGEAVGYGGRIQVAVAVGADGVVVGTAVADHVETPSFYERVVKGKFTEQLLGRSYDDAYQLGEDVDGVTGATYTSRALAEATLAGNRLVAGEQLGLAVPPEPSPSIVFGIPEITVLALFVAGYIGHKPKFKYKKQLRWATLLTGMMVLGFWFNQPLTISKVNTFLLGFWPQWQTNLYWYFLLGGIVLIMAIDNKNSYCYWFCPFGGAQDCMGAIGGAKITGPTKYRRHLLWVPRGLAWLAIILALLFRNPGISSYEVFGTLFDFTGSTVMFALLGIVMVMSLFVKRPWCNYLCPLDPVYGIIRLTRGWVLELWQKIKRKAVAQ